ncbi:hypothetical protein BDW69DRAFT_189488 [Aspergillus filifer]
MPPPTDGNGDHDGASGPSSKDAAALGSGLGLGSLALGAVAQRPRSHSTSPPASQKFKSDFVQRSVSPGPALERLKDGEARSRHPSDLRFADSTTAVPLHFRPPPLSPRLQRSPSVTEDSPTAQAVSPTSPSQGRRSRPTSWEFKNSREIRPLFLVERHGASKTEDQPDLSDPLPSLPSSKSGSSDDLPSLVLRNENAWESASPSQMQNEVLGSQQNTPTAMKFGSRHESRKKELGYEFHSPSELLQEADTGAFPDLPPLPSAEGSTVGVNDAPRELGELPPLPTSRPASPQVESQGADKTISALEAQQESTPTLGPTQDTNIPGLYEGPGFAGVVDAAVAASDESRAEAEADNDDARTVTGEEAPNLADLSPPRSPTYRERERANSETSFESAGSRVAPSPSPWGFGSVVDAAVAANSNKDKPQHAESVADTTEDEFFDAMSRDGATSRGETPTPRDEEVPWERGFETPAEVSTPTQMSFGGNLKDIDSDFQSLDRGLESNTPSKPENAAGKAETEEPPTFEEEPTIIAAEPEPEALPEIIADTKTAEELTETEVVESSSKKNKKKKGKSVDMTDHGEEGQEKALETPVSETVPTETPAEEAATQLGQAPAAGFDHPTHTKAEAPPIDDFPVTEQPATLEAEPAADATAESEPKQPEEPEETAGDAGLSKKAKKKKKKKAAKAPAEEVVEEPTPAEEASASVPSEEPIAVSESAAADELAPTDLDKPADSAVDERSRDLETIDEPISQGKPTEDSAPSVGDVPAREESAEPSALVQPEAPESSEPKPIEESAEQEPGAPLSREASKKNEKKNKRKSGAEAEVELEAEGSPSIDKDISAETPNAEKVPEAIPETEQPKPEPSETIESTVKAGTDDISQPLGDIAEQEKDLSTEGVAQEATEAAVPEEPAEEQSKEKTKKKKKKKNRKSTTVSEDQPEPTAEPESVAARTEPSGQEQQGDAGTKLEPVALDTQTLDTISAQVGDEPTQSVEVGGANDSKPHVSEQRTIEPEAQPEAGEPSLTTESEKKDDQIIPPAPEQDSPANIIDTSQPFETPTATTETGPDDTGPDATAVTQDGQATTPQESVEMSRDVNLEPAAEPGDLAAPGDRAEPATEDIPMTAAQKKKAKKDKKKKRQSASAEEREPRPEATTEEVTVVPVKTQPPAQEPAETPVAVSAEDDPATKEATPALESTKDRAAASETPLVTEPTESAPEVDIATQPTEDALERKDEAHIDPETITEEVVEEAQPLSKKDKKKKKKGGKSISVDEPEVVPANVPTFTEDYVTKGEAKDNEVAESKIEPAGPKEEVQETGKPEQFPSTTEPTSETMFTQESVAQDRELIAESAPEEPAIDDNEKAEEQIEEVQASSSKKKNKKKKKSLSASLDDDQPTAAEAPASDEPVFEQPSEPTTETAITAELEEVTVSPSAVEEPQQPVQETAEEVKEPETQEAPSAEEELSKAAKKKAKKDKKKRKSVSFEPETEPLEPAETAVEPAASESAEVTEQTAEPRDAPSEPQEVASPKSTEEALAEQTPSEDLTKEEGQTSQPEQPEAPETRPEEIELKKQEEPMSAKAKKKAKKDKKRQSKLLALENEPLASTEPAEKPTEETVPEISEEEHIPAETIISPAEQDGKDNQSRDTGSLGANDKELTWTDDDVSPQVEQQQTPSPVFLPENKSFEVDVGLVEPITAEIDVVAGKEEASVDPGLSEVVVEEKDMATEAVPNQETAEPLSKDETTEEEKPEQEAVAEAVATAPETTEDKPSSPTIPTTEAAEEVKEEESTQRPPVESEAVKEVEPIHSPVDAIPEETVQAGPSKKLSKKQKKKQRQAEKASIELETTEEPPVPAIEPAEELRGEATPQPAAEAEPIQEAEPVPETEPTQPELHVQPEETEPVVSSRKLSKKEKKKLRQAEKAEVEPDITVDSSVPAAEPAEEPKEEPAPETTVEAEPVQEVESVQPVLDLKPAETEPVGSSRKLSKKEKKKQQRQAEKAAADEENKEQIPETVVAEPETTAAVEEAKSEVPASEDIKHTEVFLRQEQVTEASAQGSGEPGDLAIPEEQPVEPSLLESTQEEAQVLQEPAEQGPAEPILEQQQPIDTSSQEKQPTAHEASVATEDTPALPVAEEVIPQTEIDKNLTIEPETPATEAATELERSLKVPTESIEQTEPISTSDSVHVNESVAEEQPVALETPKDDVPVVEDKTEEPATGKSKKASALAAAEDDTGKSNELPVVVPGPAPEPVLQTEAPEAAKDQALEPAPAAAIEIEEQPWVLAESSQANETKQEGDSELITEDKEQPAIVHASEEVPEVEISEPAEFKPIEQEREVQPAHESSVETPVEEKSFDEPLVSEEPNLSRKQSKKQKKKAKKQAKEQEPEVEPSAPTTVDTTAKDDVRPADVKEQESLPTVEPVVAAAETIEPPQFQDEPMTETVATPAEDERMVDVGLEEPLPREVGAKEETREAPVGTTDLGVSQAEIIQDNVTQEKKEVPLKEDKQVLEQEQQQDVAELVVEKDEPEPASVPVSRKLSKKEKRKLKKKAPSEIIEEDEQEPAVAAEPVEPVKGEDPFPPAAVEATIEQHETSAPAQFEDPAHDEMSISGRTLYSVTTEATAVPRELVTELPKLPADENFREVVSVAPEEDDILPARKLSKKEKKKKRKGGKVEKSEPKSEKLPVSTNLSHEQPLNRTVDPVEVQEAEPAVPQSQDEDAWPAIDWGKGKIDPVEQSSESADEAHAGPFVPEIPEFKESAIPEALLERPGESPEEAARDSKSQAIFGSTLERDVTTRNFTTPAADSAEQKLHGVESTDEKKTDKPKSGKIANIFPNLERGFFRRPTPSPTQSVKDGAEEETAELEADRDSATQVLEAPIAKGVEAQPDVRDSGYIASPALAQDDVFAPTAKEVSAELSLKRSVDTFEAKPTSTELPNIPVPIEKDDVFGTTTTKELPHIKTDLPSEQAEIPPPEKSLSILERAPSCELRRSPSIHGHHDRHNQPRLGWSLDEPEADRTATPPKQLPPIAEQEPERSMVKDGTPRLEMKPEHVLPRPQTPVRKFTDTALGRRMWPTPDNSDDDWEKVQRPSPQSLSISSLSPERGSQSGILKTPEHNKPVLRPSRPGSTTSSTHSLRRVVHSASGDLRAAALAGSEAAAPAVAPATEEAGQSRPSTPQPSRSPTDLDVSEIPSSSSYDPVTDKGKKPLRTMTDVYEGWGETPSSPRSPNRPPSIRHRRSMQHLQELEFRLDHLLQENRDLTAARDAAEEQLRKGNLARRKSDQALNTRDADLRDREAELEQLQQSVEWFQKEVARLNEENAGLTSANAGLIATHTNEINTVRQTSAREVEHLRSQNDRLSSNLHERIKTEIEAALKQKNAELRRLREELEDARDKIKELQEQISAQINDNVIAFRGEEYFEAACQKLCGHVQQWVLRFSKHSDHRRCRKLIEIKDEKIADRFDNAILDGSDTDMYLADRVRRRDVFMSVVMTMVWEFVFTRYLFGMDREQRQKLKSLEKQLIEVGPRNSIHRWRATTLTLLSKRQAFTKQRDSDTEAVALEIFDVLSRLLPPPTNVESQLLDSLRKVLRVAVALSLEMRTQLAEYIMLPPLQPEFDTNGDLARQVFFNASLMNERSGETTSNEDLQAQNAVVRVVLFPLVVKKGNDAGEGDEEVIVCPAQVLVARPGKDKRLARMASGDRMSVDGSRSVHSLAPSTMNMSMNMSMSNVI